MKGVSIQKKGQRVDLVRLQWITGAGLLFELRNLVRSVGLGREFLNWEDFDGLGEETSSITNLGISGDQLCRSCSNHLVYSLLYCGDHWWTSQVESNSMDKSCYAFEDTCEISLVIFVTFLAPNFTVIFYLLNSGCWRQRGFFIQRESKHNVVVTKVPWEL